MIAKVDSYLNIKELKKEKGITLVALVVTIIILIILAAITINLLLGDNGIIRRAVEGGKNHKLAEENERDLLVDFEQQMENATNGISNGGEGPLPVPVPPGYVVSEVLGEDTIDGGLVIYEGTDPVTEDNHADSLENRNQYVWIPVKNIDDMAMCTIHWTTVELEFDGTHLQCPICKTNTKLAGKLYAKFALNYFDPDLTGQTYSQESFIREPALVSTHDIDTNTSYLVAATEGTEITSFAQILTQMETDYKEMAESVAKHGGFYIGRYEASFDGANCESKKKKDAMNATSLSGNMWYGIYNKLRKETGTIKKHMIWGSSYDQVMKFINKKTDGVGNIYDVKVENGSRHTGSIEKTGNNEYDKVANIYDLEGNLFEWTMETYFDDQRVIRGR